MTETDLEGIKGDILIVDDDPSCLQTLTDILLGQGHEVRRARDAQTALMIVNNAPPNLILLDIRMPEMNGYQLCQKLKANEESCDIPVLFLSALDETADKVKGFNVGGVDYITKPFQLEDVLVRIHTHLNLFKLKYKLEKQNENLKNIIQERNIAQLELKKSHDELEQRVIERTSKLKEANIGLKKEITERKRTEEKLQNTFLKIEQLKDQLQQENLYLREEIEVQNSSKEIIGQSEAIRIVLSHIKKVAPLETNVLILGETGTGKELVADEIHRLSSRRNQIMIKVNCGALSPTLIENELFGREKGAYTGAVSRQTGRFEAAHNSTLFLDEIAELPQELQVKLLRVLQDRKFERLGSTKTITVDVRIIAATNQDLKDAVKKGKFRKDLYYRLNVFPVTVPPLRDRREDIPLIAWHFVREFEKAMGKKVENITEQSMELFLSYLWPGNIREMRNIIERSIILSAGPVLKVSPLLFELENVITKNNDNLEDMTRNHILDVLDSCGWQVGGINGAAQVLGLNRTTLISKMKKLQIKRS